MTYNVEKKYLVLPTSPYAKMKKISFWDKDGKCVYELDIRLDFKAGTRDVYVDMYRFIGRELDVIVTPEMTITLRQKDRKPLEKFDQPLRPKYHFTAPEGWINDPNGLVFADGIYHLFYQLNPCHTGWGNMHWGHAVSKNLVDWEHRPIALFPDSTGTMFSGGAITDEKNLVGTKYCEKTPIVLYYTAAGGKSLASEGKNFTQCMAISSDGGATFSKLADNPIINHIADENRDPKVVYSEKLGLYVMSLYIKETSYFIFTSKNMKDWEKICEIELPGDAECPAFFPMKNPDGEEKWILMGACDRYLVGSFDGKKFVPENKEPYVFTYTGKNSYAAQKFENTGERCIRLAWLMQDFATFGAHFNGAMSFPQELELRSSPNGDRLYVNPAKEIAKLRKKKEKLAAEGRNFSIKLCGIAHDISIVLDKTDGGAEMSLFGKRFIMDFTECTFGDGKHTMRFTPSEDGKFRIRMLTDTSGFEVYLSDGASYGAFTDIPDENLSTLIISTESKARLRLEEFRLRNAVMTDRRK